MPAVEMLHEIDPRESIMEKVRDVLDNIEVMGSNVLCAIYKRPEKTKSGLYMPDAARDEDVYQGKVMLVLKLGPKAFADDEYNHFTDAERFKVGDWAVARASDSWRVTFNTLKSVTSSQDNRVDLRLIKDISLQMRITHPDYVY